MSRDELRQPLKKRKLTQRLWASRPSLLLSTSVMAAVAFLAASVWAVRTPYPFAGEPIVTAAIPPPEEIKTSSIAPPKEGEEEVAAQESVSDDAAPPAVTVDAPVAQDVYQTEASIEVAPRRPLRAAPVPELVDTSLGGQLPRISASNKKPSDVYARLTPMGVIHSNRPKIAILLGGMGLNPKLTKSAIDDLPGDVTFAFAPYGENLQAQVDKARANGHEVLLQLPMEPMGYPANNPGPKTLLADADVNANMEALHWHMGRFTGYTGITNYMGGRLLSTASALKPVLQEIQKRGLVYLEDSSTSLTSSTDVAKDVDLPERHAQIVIDSDPTPQSIANALDLLENEARTNGYAIGTGSGLQVTLDAVKAWSEQLKNKGILLVPVSAMYKGKLG